MRDAIFLLYPLPAENATFEGPSLAAWARMGYNQSSTERSRGYEDHRRTSAPLSLRARDRRHGGGGGPCELRGPPAAGLWGAEHGPRGDHGQPEPGGGLPPLPPGPVPLLRGAGQPGAGERGDHPGGPARPGGGAPEAGGVLRREALPGLQQDLAHRPHLRPHLPPGGEVRQAGGRPHGPHRLLPGLSEVQPPPGPGRGGGGPPPHPVRHVPLRQPLPPGGGRRAGEKPERVHRPVRPAGGPGGPGRVLPGAGGLCRAAAHLAELPGLLGPGDVRHRLAHRQSGGVHRVHPAHRAGAILGTGLL